jgi:hypothetical protein
VCTDTTTDAQNCGGCGLACSMNNVTGVACVAGKCTGTCVTGFADCNQNLQKDGCESNPMSDVANCGGCGMACSTNHVIAGMCTAGQCTGSCEGGFSDCDSNLRTNGCETATGADPDHCGSCTAVCSTNHMASRACTDGFCGGTCAPLWGDCNNDLLSDGCETSLNTATSCGTCGLSCASGVACMNGQCACSMAGQTACPTIGCTDLTTDVKNCGGCGQACSTNQIAVDCAAGVCDGACFGTFADCNNDKLTDGCEVDLSADIANCGGCKMACSQNHITATCGSGTCEGACLSGWADCNNDKRTDGCEFPVSSDTNNCGGCGVVCTLMNVPTPVCTNGVCSGNCAAGWADCNHNLLTDGCETNLLATDNNCGACGNSCVSPTFCQNGVCGCSGALVACGSVCTSTDSDIHNCGTCGTLCSSQNEVPGCSMGKCAGTCNSGWADCDHNQVLNGCETQTTSDVKNCGGCGMACSTNHVSPQCSMSSCASGICDPGFDDCNNDKLTDGCEVDLGSDPLHCGSCNAACSKQNVPTPTCTNAVCDGACAANWGDCNMDKLVDGCETNLLNDLFHCGSCFIACAAGKSCVNGLCQ